MISLKRIVKLFEDIELRLVESLKRNLGRHKQEEQDEGFEWSAWQAEKLRNIEKYRRQNRRIMQEYSSTIDEETRELMQEQFREGEALASSEFGVRSSELSDEHFFGVNEDKMNSLIDDITTLEEKAESAALRTMDDVYRSTVNRAQLEMATGSMTINQAVDMATKDFLAQGINCIVYRNGRRVNIADYVRMALRTTSTRATLQGKAAKYAVMGYDTVIVSQYGMCSNTCLPWQGKVYIDDVFRHWEGEIMDGMGKSNYCGKWFTLLSTAMEAGLFHPNCRHTMNLWIEGVSKLPEPLDEKEIRERYKAEQIQRALEREVRKCKRQVLGLQDPEAVKKAKQKLRDAQKALKDHVDKHDYLRRDYDREKIYDTASPQLPKPSPSVNTPPKSEPPQNADTKLSEPLPEKPKSVPEVKPAEVDAPVPEHNYPEDSKTYVDEPLPENVVKADEVKVPVEEKISPESVDKSGESGIMESEGNHAIGDPDAEPYEPPYDYEASITDEAKEVFDEEYKLAVEKFGEFDTVHGVEVLNDKSTDQGNYNDNSMMVALRHANKKDYLKVVALIAQQEKQKGEWSTGHSNHAIRHELGHAIQLYHSKNDPEWQTKWRKVSEIFNAIANAKTENDKKGYSFPSRYSDKDVSEFVSECIAASYSKKQSKTVKEVIKILFGEVLL